MARQFAYDKKTDIEQFMTKRNTHVFFVTYEPGNSDIGKTVIDTLTINTNIEGFEEITVPVYARVVNPVGLYPSVLLFLDTKPDEVPTRKIEVVPLDGRPFQIVSVNTGNLEIDYVILPGLGNRKTLKFTAKGKKLLSMLDTSLEIEIEIEDASTEKQILRLPIYVK